MMAVVHAPAARVAACGGEDICGSSVNRTRHARRAIATAGKGVRSFMMPGALCGNANNFRSFISVITLE